MTDIAEQIARLSPAKRALLEQRLHGKEPVPGLPPPITRRGSDIPVSLSSAQQRLWFFHQWEPDSPLYNSPVLLRLRGELDRPALQRALDALAVRHEILRTAFGWQESNPTQTAMPPAPVELRSVPDSPSSVWSVEEIRRPFDLAGGTLLRAALEQIGPEDHRLLLTVPHIIFDGWSRGILLRDMAVLYSAFVMGEDPALPLLPIRYSDYAAWQQKRLESAAVRGELAYWKEQLDGLPAALDLPTDRPRPALQSYRGARLPLHLPAKLTEDLRRLGWAEGATPFMVLLTAFQTLLLRYTGQSDLAVGAPIAGRTRTETEDLVGCFINTLVLRTDLSGSPAFREALARTRRVCLEAYAHQEVPFESLVQELRTVPDLSRSPLIQVMLVLQNAPRPGAAFAGLQCEPEEVDAETSKLDLTLNLEPDGEGLSGWLEYSTDLFDRATIERLRSHFLTLLEGIIANPSSEITALPLLTAPERSLLLEEWGTAEPVPASDRCLHHLVEVQAAKTPDAVAVTCGDRRLSYAALNSQADRLARRLRGCGVGPETLVGLCLARSADMVVAVLGILKAGGAYVPLDPEYPADRVAFMLKDANASFVVTERALLPRLPDEGIQFLCIDNVPDAPALDEDDGAASGHEAGPGNLAYILYTSGSTGRPKGVAVEHRSGVALVDWARGVYSAEDLAVTLASTSLGFDLSVFELFVPLSVGGTIRVVENALALSETPEAADVTLINTVPSVMAELLRAGGVPPRVRVVNLAGEPLPGTLAQRLYEQTSAKLVFNLYGPTEDTTYSTAALVMRGAAGDPPIGSPITGTSAYVLDGSLSPVPIGIPGELYLGGAGLARGYLGRPDLTVERFVPNPFGKSQGERLYRTGDRVRWRADGRLEYLGRLDHQVKLRGFRIELGEVESALVAHPAVQECAVVVREDTPGDPRLVAYLVSLPGMSVLDAGKLRQFLRQTLPEYMIPSAFVILDALPLTPNGKRSRVLLPLPVRAVHAETAAYTAPTDPLEEAVCAVWSELLGVETVSIHDSFFDLGGHSLLAMQAASRLSEALARDIPLRLLFEAPTASELAAALLHGSVNRAADSARNAPISGPRAAEDGPAGSVDRHHLPAPETTSYENTDGYAPPRSLLQATLQSIWQELLAVWPVGVRDDFFALGGHSLLAAALMERVAQATGRRVPLAAFFGGATIERLAAALLAQDEAAIDGISAVQRSGSRTPLFFLHGDFHGGGLYCARLARALGPEQPFYAISPLGLSGEDLPDSIPGIAARHVEALRRFQPYGPYRLGGFCNGGLVAYEMARVLEAHGETVEALALVHASPLAIRFSPLRRAARSLGRRAGLGDADLHRGLETLRAVRYRRGMHHAFARNDGSVREPDIIMKLYRRLLGYYTPGPYAGSISLFWPETEPVPDADPQGRGWTGVAGTVNVISIPGDHYSCLIGHADALGAALAQTLA